MFGKILAVLFGIAWIVVGILTMNGTIHIEPNLGLATIVGTIMVGFGILYFVLGTMKN